MTTSDDGAVMAGAEERADPKPEWLVVDAPVRYRADDLPLSQRPLWAHCGTQWVTEVRHRSDGWYARIRSTRSKWGQSDGAWVWAGALRPATPEEVITPRR